MRSHKLTYNERAIVKSWGKDPYQWEKVKEFTDRGKFLMRHIYSGVEIEIPNYKKGEKICQ